MHDVSQAAWAGEDEHPLLLASGTEEADLTFFDLEETLASIWGWPKFLYIC